MNESDVFRALVEARQAFEKFEDRLNKGYHPENEIHLKRIQDITQELFKKTFVLGGSGKICGACNGTGRINS